MMKKTNLLSMLLLFTLILALLSGCGSQNKLAECFDADTVKEQALADIQLAESNDFKGWQARFAPGLQSAVTEDAYSTFLATLNEKGDFSEFGKTAVIGQEQNGQNYAVAVVLCKYKNGQIQYTIAYDENMHLIQFTI